MKTIWKYRLEIYPGLEAEEMGLQIIQVPKGATFLSVAFQQGLLYLWAEVETDNVIEDAFIEIVGTENPVMKIEPPRIYRNYIGTVQMDQSYHSFVWHVYEQK